MTTFYVDEAGFTGEDLLAADQPLFVEATNNLTDVEAASIAANIFAGVGLRELKYSRLSRRENHRTRIVELIKVLADDPLRSGVWIAHKEYALVTFIVDRWIEPFAYRTGLNLYKDGGQIALSNMLYMCLQGFWDDKFRRKILLAFQQMFRSRTKERFVECESLIAKHRNKAADQQRDEILSYLHLPFSGLGFSYLENLASHALDLAVPALAIIGHTWRERSSQPLNLIHDQSSNMAKQKWLWEKLSSPEFAPGQFAFPGGTATFPMNVTGTKFEDSANAKQLQFCDILAGATAAYFRARALGASLAGEEYISNLETAGIEKLVIGTIWPTTDISPEALGTKGWDGNIALEWLTGNLAKADSTN